MLQFVQTQNGETAYKPKQEINKVDGLIKYLRVMCIYGVCYLKKFPTRAPEFLQYLHSIIDADRQYRWLAVYTYDQKFRFHRQKNPAHSWAQVNWEFCNELAAAYNIKKFAPKHSPSKPYKQLPYNRPAAYCPRPLPLDGNTGAPFSNWQQKQCCCKDFNWSSCSHKDCKYLHACEKCKGVHHKTPGCVKH